MKRFLSAALVVCILAASMTFTACVSAENASLIIDGEQMSTDVTFVDGTAMAPMRTIFEAMGLNVNWESINQTIYAVGKSDTIVMTVGETAFTVNGEEMTAETAPQLIDDAVYVPLRAIGEALGAEIDYDSASRVITVTTDESSSDDSWKSNTGSADLDSMTCMGSGIAAEDGNIVITAAGVYEISGTMADGMIYINCDGKVKLQLSGVNITNSDGPAIFAEDSKKLIIDTTENTENYLSDGSEYSADIDAKGTVFSNDDIELQGDGMLYVYANYNHGIVSDDDITVEGGTINIDAKAGDGMHANDGIKIIDGTINITAICDGIQSEGYLTIYDGSINITTTGEVTASQGEGMFGGGMGGGRGGMAAGEMPSNDSAADGQLTDRQSIDSQPADNQPADGQMMPRGGMQRDFGTEEGTQNFGRQMMPSDGGQPSEDGEMPTPPDMENGGEAAENNGFGGNREQMRAFGDDLTDDSEDDEESTEASTKGLKAETTLWISGGDIDINSTDTAVKASLIIIDDGDITISSSVKKGIKAMSDLFVNGGNININSANEGMETKHVMTINGGNIDITASEDGINAGGSTGMGVGMSTPESNASHSIVINDGNIVIDSKNDGIDSNGSIYINGGNVVIYGPNSSADTAFDTDGTFEINGGFAVGLGSAGMLELPDESSAQNVLCVTLDSMQQAGTTFCIKDDDGNVLLAVDSDKEYQAVIFSSPDVEQGKTYTAYTGADISGELENTTYANASGGTEAGSAAAESAVTSIGSSAGGMGGGMNGGGKGGMGGGMHGQGGQRNQDQSQEGGAFNSAPQNQTEQTT